MTTITAPTEQTVTAGSLLFGTPDAGAAVDSLLSRQALLEAVADAHRLSANVHDALQHEVTEATGNLLQLDVVDLLVRAWSKHAELVAAARRTAQAPGTSEVVQLATHRVTSVHHPYIDLVVDEVRIGRIHLELNLLFILRGVLAVVAYGDLVAIRCGNCTASAALSIEGLPVASREATFDLRGKVTLGQGVPLLREQPRY